MCIQRQSYKKSQYIGQNNRNHCKFKRQKHRLYKISIMNQIDKVFYSDPVMRSFDQIPTEKRIRDRSKN